MKHRHDVKNDQISEISVFSQYFSVTGQLHKNFLSGLLSVSTSVNQLLNAFCGRGEAFSSVMSPLWHQVSVGNLMTGNLRSKRIWRSIRRRTPNKESTLVCKRQQLHSHSFHFQESDDRTVNSTYNKLKSADTGNQLHVSAVCKLIINHSPALHSYHTAVGSVSQAAWKIFFPTHTLCVQCARVIPVQHSQRSTHAYMNPWIYSKMLISSSSMWEDAVLDPSWHKCVTVQHSSEPELSTRVFAVAVLVF